MVAEALSRAWGNEEGVNESDKLNARTYGELCATYTVLHMKEISDRDNSRGIILNRLRLSPPSRGDLGNYIAEILKKCRPASRELMSATEVTWHVTPVPSRGVSYQTFEFYKLRGQTLPMEVFASDIARKSWASLSDVSIDHVNLDGVDFSLVEDIREVWRLAGPDTIFGYYEGRGYANMNRGQSIIAAAMFTYLTALTKERNITDSWVQRRLAQFKSSVPDIVTENFVSAAVIVHFVNMYPMGSSEWEQIYRQLIVLYSQLKAPQTTSLTWIIEQTANANVTSLLTIADVVSRLAFFDTDILEKKGVPPENFRATIQLALQIGRNPFSTIVKPDIQFRSYADLAVMCVHIKKDLIEDKVFVGYKAQPTNMCTLSSHDLRALGKRLFDISKEVFGDGINTEQLFADLEDNKNVTITSIRGHMFTVPTSTAGHQAGPSTSIDDDPTGLAAAERASWPKAALNLPKASKMISTTDLLHRILEKRSQKSIAYINIMKWCHSQVQAPLPIMPENAINYPLPFRSIPGYIVEAAQAWGVEVPDEWKLPAAPYQVTEMTTVLETRHVYVAPRKSVNNPQSSNPGPSPGTSGGH